MTSKKYKYFIFDWDGTLANTLNIWFRAYKDLFGEYGVKTNYIKIAENAYGNTYGSQNFGIDDYKKFNDQLYKQVREQYHMAPLYPNVKRVLKNIHDRDYRIAIASSTPRELLLKALEYHKLESLISLIIGREDVKEVKPNPQAINLALKNNIYSRDYALLIGDSDKDIIAGNKSNVDTVLFTPKQNSKYSSSKIVTPTYIITSMLEMNKLTN